MSRYVLKPDQLDALLNQLKHLNRLNEAKDEKIKDLELHRIWASSSENPALISALGKMDGEIRELKNYNRELVADKMNKSRQIEELEILLREERKLREYFETFAKEIELRCAEESMNRELTAELCRLQKDEIEIENKKISELQNKLIKLSMENEKNHDKENSRHAARDEMKGGMRRNRNYLLDISGQFGEQSDSSLAAENAMEKRTLDVWLGKIGLLAQDLSDIERIKKDLNYLRFEIESRRKSSGRNL